MHRLWDGVPPEVGGKDEYLKLRDTLNSVNYKTPNCCKLLGNGLAKITVSLSQIVLM